MQATVERTAERPRLLTPPQAARELGRAPRVIQIAVRDGTIPSVQIGKRRYITAAVVERLLRGESALSPDAAPVPPRAFAGGIRMD